MKRNFNVIQIKGIKGIIYVALIGCCLIAGFGWFPGWVCMKIWNLIATYSLAVPSIGIIQGLLLWGIVVASYFTFRKDRLVVCMKGSDGLSEEELKSIFADMKKHAQQDTFIKDMIKAQQAELKIRNLSETNIPQTEVTEDLKEKIETK